MTGSPSSLSSSSLSSSSHPLRKCATADCSHRVEENYLFCRSCWEMLPLTLRTDLKRAWGRLRKSPHEKHLLETVERLGEEAATLIQEGRARQAAERAERKARKAARNSSLS